MDLHSPQQLPEVEHFQWEKILLKTDIFAIA